MDACMRELESARDPLTVNELSARTGFWPQKVRASLDRLMGLGDVTREVRRLRPRNQGANPWEYTAKSRPCP